MHIIVPIKQVPESSNVKMDPETGTMIRSGTISVLNPLDLYALETALRLKEQMGGTVTALTMGPQNAKRILAEAIAMGADGAVHLSDRSFGGSDTYATSYILALAIKKLGEVDLILTGERATDGDTAQVGPGIAAWLDMPIITYVSSLNHEKDSIFHAERLVEEGYQQLRFSIPAVLSVVKEIAEVRLPTLRGKKRAMVSEIPTWGFDELKPEVGFIGLKGSPTRVVKIETPKVQRTCTVVKANDDSPAEAVAELIQYLEGKGLLPTLGDNHA